MARKFVNNRTVKNFQRNISNLFDSLGREITVIIGSGIPSSNFDPVNLEPIDPNEEIVYDDTTYIIDKALIEWADSPSPYEFISPGRLSPGDVRIVCKVEDVLMSGSDINNDTIFDYARYIIVDGQYVKTKSKPTKSGLRDLFILDVICSRVDEP